VDPTYTLDPDAFRACGSALALDVAES